MKEYLSHPLSELFPLMPVSDIKELADDIKQRGLQNPITLYEDKILDGRHRYEACGIAGVKPRFEIYKGKDPLGYVIAANLKRRHLTTSQKAMIAASIADLKPGEAGQTVANSQTKGQSANLRPTHEDAAKALAVSPRTVDTASRILDESPKLAAQVRDGKITVHAAAEKLAEKKAAKEVQRDAIGYPIPDGCLPHWNRRHEIQELMIAVSRVKTIIEKARAEDDVLFRLVNQAIIDQLERSYSFLSDAKPFAVCLTCQGQTRDSCRVCKGTGLVSKFGYEVRADKTLRAMRAKVIAKGDL